MSWNILPVESVIEDFWFLDIYLYVSRYKHFKRFMVFKNIICVDGKNWACKIKNFYQYPFKRVRKRYVIKKDIRRNHSILRLLYEVQRGCLYTIELFLGNSINLFCYILDRLRKIMHGSLFIFIHFTRIHSVAFS